MPFTAPKLPVWIATFILCSVVLVGYMTSSTSLPVVWSASMGTHAAKQRYTYEGEDFPRTWPLPPLDRVYMSHEDTVHYAIDTPLGAAEWNCTLPNGRAVVYLGESAKPFTVAMFHEIRCLNIIRQVLNAFYEDDSAPVPLEPPGIVQHCMNYIRQMVLCRANLRLESIRSPTGSKKAVSDITHECRDWVAVYEAAYANHREHSSKP
ncbi:hypothetical protein GY45DRAFT_1322804 [Cubamyces sp. BRFM 1775]|nr:hypothetical protein GY45DRAFT_1322804 [Cubamyces sp. BRFM 1775]